MTSSILLAYKASGRLALAVLLAANVGPTARGATASLAPLKDNTLVQGTNPTSQNSGGQGDIFVGRTGQDGQGAATISIRRGLIAFDLASSLPVGASITAASLTMRDTMGLNGDQTVSLHRLQQDWGEGASLATAPAANGDATWLYTFFNSANPGASPTWTTPGGSYVTAASGATVVDDNAGAGQAQLFTWSSAANPQMLADVQQWYANPASNFGWIMIGNEAAGNTAKRLNGGEATPPGVAPVLQVEYFIPEPTATTLAAAAVLGAFFARRRRS